MRIAGAVCNAALFHDPFVNQSQPPVIYDLNHDSLLPVPDAVAFGVGRFDGCDTRLERFNA